MLLLLNIYRYDQVILKPSPKNLFLIHLTEIFGFICQFLQTVPENQNKKKNRYVNWYKDFQSGYWYSGIVSLSELLCTIITDSSFKWPPIIRNWLALGKSVNRTVDMFREAVFGLILAFLVTCIILQEKRFEELDSAHSHLWNRVEDLTQANQNLSKIVHGLYWLHGWLIWV